jgi:hypothetical protein
MLDERLFSIFIVFWYHMELLPCSILLPNVAFQRARLFALRCKRLVGLSCLRILNSIRESSMPFSGPFRSQFMIGAGFGPIWPYERPDLYRCRAPFRESGCYGPMNGPI